MFKVIDSQILQDGKEMFRENINCKYIVRDYAIEGANIARGYLYAISTSPDNNDELYHCLKDLKMKGVECILSGSYNKDGGVYVQYEVRK